MIELRIKNNEEGVETLFFIRKMSNFSALCSAKSEM